MDEVNISTVRVTSSKKLYLSGGGFAMVVDNVFSVAECQSLIDRAEHNGYEPALVNTGGGKQSYYPGLRKGDRCVLDDQTLANDLFQRIKPYLPTEKGYVSPRKNPLKFPLKGLNERLRFLKYHAGDYFKPHYDGCYSRPDGSEMSWMTVMVYLNDGDSFEGGRTSLLKEEARARWTEDDSLHKVEHSIVPRPGRVLIFDHNIFHVGEDVIKGTKLCIRTDVMYENVSEF